MNFSLSGSYGFPASGKDYWVTLLLIANNSPLGNYVPIPGVIYIHRGERFTGVFGFPVVSLQWTPTTLWSYSLSVFGPILTAEATYGEVDKTQFFLQAGFSQQNFILHERIRERDRLTLQEKRILIGMRAPIFNSAYGEFQIGKAFDRSAYIGEHILNTDGGLADLDATGFLNLQLKYVF